MKLRKVRQIALSVSLLCACGTPAEQNLDPSTNRTAEQASATDHATTETSEHTPPTPPEENPSAPSNESAPYTLHEWGLIDVLPGQTQIEVAAGPGSPEAAPSPAVTPAPQRPSRPSNPVREENARLPIRPTASPSAPSRPSAQRRKPVIYVHLLDNVSEFTFNLSVTLPRGEIIEHWPDGAREEHGLRWSPVQVTAGFCRAEAYPTPSDARCQNLPDNYCEVAELRAYETEDSDCVQVGTERTNHLFYRGDGTQPELPLAVSLDGTNVLVENRSMDFSAAPLLRVIRGEGPAMVRMVPLPDPGTRVTIARPDHANALVEARGSIATALTALGLTDAERQAFLNAWSDELLGPADTPPVAADALLYWLPSEDVNALAELQATPPPRELHRAMMVRVDLTRPAE